MVFFKILNRKQSPELKLPWLFLLIAFPMVGAVLYLMLTNSKMTKFQSKNYHEIYQSCKKILDKEKNEKPTETNEISQFSPTETNHDEQKILGDYVGIENYLRNSSHTKGTMGNEVVFLKNGMKFHEELLKELKKAKKFIFLEYFIIDKGEFWGSIHDILLEKVSSGVEVKVLYDDMGTMGKLMSGYYKHLNKEGIECRKFNKFSAIISGIHNNRDHRKLCIIDNSVGFTGGINLADEYINRKQPFGVWKDSAVKIKGPVVSNMTTMFLQMFDIQSKHRLDYSKYLLPCKESGNGQGVVNVFGSGPAPFYKDLVGENNFLNMIGSAKKKIYITTPYLIIDFALMTALKNAALKGIDVRIITPHIPDKKLVFNVTRSNYKPLLEAGVKIYEYTPGFIHSKELLVDDDLVFIGTINLDYRSLVHHYECGAVIYKNDAILDIAKDFDDLFGISQEITLENFKMNKLAELGNSFIALFVPLL